MSEYIYQVKEELRAKYDEFRHELIDVFVKRLSENKRRNRYPATIYAVDKRLGHPHPFLYRVLRPRREERDLGGVGLSIIFKLMWALDMTAEDVFRELKKLRSAKRRGSRSPSKSRTSGDSS